MCVVGIPMFYVFGTKEKKMHPNVKEIHNIQALRLENAKLRASEDISHDLKLLLIFALDRLNFVCEQKEFCINCPLNEYIEKDSNGNVIGCGVPNLIDEASKFGIKVGD